MAIANITNNILTDSGVATSSLLPLSGGTLTGSLSGTSATFSGNMGVGGGTTEIAGFTSLTINNSSSGSFLDLNNSGVNNLRFLSLSSVDQRIQAQGTLRFDTGGTKRFEILSTGAATFSSSVTAGDTLTINTPSSSTSIALRGRVGDNFSAIRFQSNNGATTYSTIYTNSSDLHFENGGSLRMLISSGGNVGIGTSSPTLLLDIEGQAGQFGSSSAYRTSRFTSKSSVVADKPGIILGYDTSGGGVIAAATESSGQPLNFWTYNGSTWGERMRITSGGDVGIGNSGFPSTRLTVTGKSNTGSDYSFVANNASNQNLFLVRNDGIIAANGIYTYNYASTANVFVQSDGVLGRNSSSLKYKKNIENYSKGLDYVLKLRPVLYESKNPYENGLKFTGFIAEEVDKIGLNELVHYDNNKPDSLHYPHFVALLTKAIQEQQAQIEELKALIAAK